MAKSYVPYMEYSNSIFGFIIKMMHMQKTLNNEMHKLKQRMY